MASHEPSRGLHHHLDRYQDRTLKVLDRYKAGEISQTEAISQHSQATVEFTSQLTEAFVIRLRTLEAFRTPRGESIVPPAGR